MFGLALNILLISFFANQGQAETIDDLQKQYMDYLKECLEEYTPTPAEMEQLKNSKMPDSENVKCYFACAFKKTGMMNDKGEFWVDGVKSISMEHYGNDEKMIKKVNDFIEVCKKVNDVPVKDGEKGCERAALMFECSNKNAPEFGFV